MSDPAVREKMMERFRQFREAQERGDIPDFGGDFGGFGGDFGAPAEAPATGDSQNEKAATKSDDKSGGTKTETNLGESESKATSNDAK
jgi:hypothetical protein